MQIDSNLKNRRISTDYENELNFTEEICEKYAFDYRAIKA
jgi:hypothetical protein